MHRTPTGAMDENWRKIYRSLIFMDSWLSYTLGYSSEATPQDIQVRQHSTNDHTHLTRTVCMHPCAPGFRHG